MTTKTPLSKRSTFDRRRVLKGMAASSVALAGFPYIAKAKPATMTVPNSGGALEEAFKVAYFDTFQKKTGIQILGAPYMDTARVKAMVENNAVDVDILNIDATEAAALARLGLLEPIDYSLFPQFPKRAYGAWRISKLRVSVYNTLSLANAGSIAVNCNISFPKDLLSLSFLIFLVF